MSVFLILISTNYAPFFYMYYVLFHMNDGVMWNMLLTALWQQTHQSFDICFHCSIIPTRSKPLHTLQVTRTWQYIPVILKSFQAYPGSAVREKGVCLQPRGYSYGSGAIKWPINFSSPAVSYWLSVEIKKMENFKGKSHDWFFLLYLIKCWSVG